MRPTASHRLQVLQHDDRSTALLLLLACTLIVGSSSKLKDVWKGSIVEGGGGYVLGMGYGVCLVMGLGYVLSRRFCGFFITSVLTLQEQGVTSIL